MSKLCRVKYIDESYKDFPDLRNRLTDLYHNIWRKVTDSKLFRQYGDNPATATYLFSSSGTSQYKKQRDFIIKLNENFNAPKGTSVIVAKPTKAGNNLKVVVNVHPLAQQEYDKIQEAKPRIQGVFDFSKPDVSELFESYYTNGFSKVPDHKSWYMKDHLQVVQKIVDDLHAKYGGDKSIMDLMVYTHDLAKAINNESKSHRETVKPILENMGYPQSTINEVIRNIEMMDAVKTQDLQDIPIEVRILSTADALSHYTTGNRGFLNIFSTETTMGDMNVIKESNLRKIEKDKRKILLPGFSLNDTKLEYYGRITSVSGSVTNYLNSLLNETASQKLIEPISDQEISEVYRNKIEYLKVQNLPIPSYEIFKSQAKALEEALKKVKGNTKETILEAIKCL